MSQMSKVPGLGIHVRIIEVHILGEIKLGCGLIELGRFLKDFPMIVFG